MPRAVLVASLLLATLGSPAAGQDAASEPAVRRLDSLWAGSYASHDTVLAVALLSDRLLMTSGTGRIKSRADELDDIRPHAGFTVPYFRTVDVQVRMHGATAVVAGRIEWATESGGRRAESARRYTATWVRGGPQGWQMVALHIGPTGREP